MVAAGPGSTINTPQKKNVLWATASHSQGQSRLAHKIQILSFSRKVERLSAVSQIWNQYEVKEYFKAKFYLKTWIWIDVMVTKLIGIAICK